MSSTHTDTLLSTFFLTSSFSWAPIFGDTERFIHYTTTSGVHFRAEKTKHDETDGQRKLPPNNWRTTVLCSVCSVCVSSAQIAAMRLRRVTVKLSCLPPPPPPPLLQWTTTATCLLLPPSVSLACWDYSTTWQRVKKETLGVVNKKRGAKAQHRA